MPLINMKPDFKPFSEPVAGRKIDFQQFRKRESAGFGTLLRMAVYALIISGMALGLMEMIRTLSGG
jgi:hypothetical protein